MSTAAAETRNDPYDRTIPPTIRARMDAVPLLTPAEEAALFRRIRSLHDAAWDAVLLDGGYADRRADDPEWEALRRCQADVRATVPRVLRRHGSAHARDRADAKFWLAEVDRTAADLDAAVEHAVAANLRMCVHVAAQKFFRSPLPLPDRIQAAAMGCLRAVRGFNPKRGFKFSTYASAWIKQAIQREEANTAATIRLPVHMVETRRVVLRAVAALSAERDGGQVTVAEVEAHAGRTAQQARQVARLPRVVSADAPLHLECKNVRDAGRLTMLDTIADPQVADAGEAIDEARRAEALAEALRRLRPVLRTVMTHRLGVDDSGRAASEPETLRDIGARLGVSRERIRQLEADGVQMLQVLVPALLTPAARRTTRQRIALEQAASV